MPADFNYALTSPSPLPLPGTIHTGFHSLAVIIWPGLKAALQALWARSGGISHVYVSGEHHMLSHPPPCALTVCDRGWHSFACPSS